MGNRVDWKSSLVLWLQPCVWLAHSRTAWQQRPTHRLFYQKSWQRPDAAGSLPDLQERDCDQFLRPLQKLEPLSLQGGGEGQRERERATMELQVMEAGSRVPAGVQNKLLLNFMFQASAAADGSGPIQEPSGTTSPTSVL